LRNIDGEESGKISSDVRDKEVIHGAQKTINTSDTKELSSLLEMRGKSNEEFMPRFFVTQDAETALRSTPGLRPKSTGKVVPTTPKSMLSSAKKMLTSTLKAKHTSVKKAVPSTSETTPSRVRKAVSGTSKTTPTTVKRSVSGISKNTPTSLNKTVPSTSKTTTSYQKHSVAGTSKATHTSVNETVISMPMAKAVSEKKSITKVTLSNSPSIRSLNTSATSAIRPTGVKTWTQHLPKTNLTAKLEEQMSRKQDSKEKILENTTQRTTCTKRTKQNKTSVSFREARAEIEKFTTGGSIKTVGTRRKEQNSVDKTGLTFREARAESVRFATRRRGNYGTEVHVCNQETMALNSAKAAPNAMKKLPNVLSPWMTTDVSIKMTEQNTQLRENKITKGSSTQETPEMRETKAARSIGVIENDGVEASTKKASVKTTPAHPRHHDVSPAKKQSADDTKKIPDVSVLLSRMKASVKTTPALPRLRNVSPVKKHPRDNTSEVRDVSVESSGKNTRLNVKTTPALPRLRNVSAAKKQSAYDTSEVWDVREESSGKKTIVKTSLALRQLCNTSPVMTVKKQSRDNTSEVRDIFCKETISR
jgi:hypothetical protein